MQKKYLICKCILTVVIFFLFMYNIKTYAVNEANSTVNSSSDIVVGGDYVTNNIENSENDNTIEEEHNEDIGSTGNSTNTVEEEQTLSITSTPKTAQPTSSYSTVATIPEANLTINNLLNAVLIAVGIIIILLAIAILIRLK